MGILIDEIIDDLTELKIRGVVPFTKGSLSGGNYKIITEQSLNEAIDIMHKYKKIEQLYYAWIATLPPKNAEEFLIKIGEVIVDKNDNLDIKQFERY